MDWNTRGWRKWQSKWFPRDEVTKHGCTSISSGFQSQISVLGLGRARARPDQTVPVQCQHACLQTAYSAAAMGKEEHWLQQRLSIPQCFQAETAFNTINKTAQGPRTVWRAQHCTDLYYIHQITEELHCVSLSQKKKKKFFFWDRVSLGSLSCSGIQINRPGWFQAHRETLALIPSTGI